MKNADIVKARIALAKLANADVPAPLLMKLDPTLAAAEEVIKRAEEAEGTDEKERYLSERAEVPVCAIPALPEIRMSWLDMDVLRGIVNFEEVG
jgi:hypothetical protein